MSLRCAIVDDNQAFLQAAGTLLERQGVTVVGGASNAADALRQATDLRPDVVLVDIVLGAESGFELTRQLAGHDGGGPTVILISTHSEADFADQIEESPAAGFVAKPELSADVIRSLVR